MANLINKSALEFFRSPTAAQDMIDAFNELTKAHNNLCLAHDELVEQFKEVSDVVDTLMDAVFEDGPGELDS